MHRTVGGLIAGTLFVLPGLIAIMALSWIYAAFGNVGIVQGLFFGLKAAVLAIVLQAVVRIGKRALKNWVMLGISAAAFVAIFVFHVPFPVIILAAGLIGFIGGRLERPEFLVGGGHGASGGKVLADADSLLGEGTPVVVVATESPVLGKLRSNVAEVRARGAHVLAIATEGSAGSIADEADELVLVPPTDVLLSPVPAVVPLQLLAYGIARARGLDPDRPRNLAKTVTVE